LPTFVLNNSVLTQHFTIMKRIAVSLLLFFFVSGAFAQKYSLVSGDLSPLKGMKQFVFAFEYENMTVGKKSEEVYVSEKVADYNKKEPGRGDQWKAAWVGDRASRFEPAFIELFNKYGEEFSAHGDKANAQAQCKITVKTVFTEPGYNIGISRADANINVEYVFTLLSDPSKPVAVLSCSRIPGRVFLGNDYDTGVRIMEAYAKAGKSLVDYLEKPLWK